MSTPETNPESPDTAANQVRDIAEVAAVEIITTAAVHLMSAAAVKCGLAAGDDAEELKDLDEARKLITALAGLITAAAPEVGSQHAAPLRDGLRSLQLAFREASLIPDEPGKGPGEKFTGPVTSLPPTFHRPSASGGHWERGTPAAWRSSAVGHALVRDRGLP